MGGLGGWIVVRTILIADVVLLLAVGFAALIWVSQPAGALGAIFSWLAAGVLLALLPTTDPYRVQARRARRLAARHPR
jgi:hypothetical protein